MMCRTVSGGDQTNAVCLDKELYREPFAESNPNSIKALPVFASQRLIVISESTSPVPPVVAPWLEDR